MTICSKPPRPSDLSALVITIGSKVINFESVDTYKSMSACNRAAWSVNKVLVTPMREAARSIGSDVANSALVKLVVLVMI